MAVVCAEAFPVGGEPGADDLVFGAGEEDIAVFGVSVGRESDSDRVRQEGCCLWGKSLT